ncbi:carboxypeptidase-like regulatory domain-containing protein [Pontimicrobium sp. MEBiC01747]
MKSFVISCLALFLLISCSDNEETSSTTETFAVAGKLLAPNNTDPIFNGLVTVNTNTTTIKQTRTDSKGEFSLNIPKGEYTITLSKGKFSTQKEITVNEETPVTNFTLDVLPKIAVVTGHYDKIENILYNIGLVNPINGDPLFDIVEGINLSGKTSNPLNHNHGAINTNKNDNLEPNVDFDFGDLIASPELLAEYDIIFLNCGLNESKTEYNNNILNYVTNGGILYTTDWAFKYLNEITNNNTEYLEFYTPEKSGVSTSTEAEILDQGAIAWLEINFGISIDNMVEIEGFLNSWQVVNSYNSDTAVSWINGPVEYNDENGNVISENKDLAFTFLVGDGGVFYSSFHTHGTVEGFTDLDRVMEFFVFELSDI